MKDSITNQHRGTHRDKKRHDMVEIFTIVATERYDSDQTSETNDGNGEEGSDPR